MMNSENEHNNGGVDRHQHDDASKQPGAPVLRDHLELNIDNNFGEANNDASREKLQLLQRSNGDLQKQFGKIVMSLHDVSYRIKVPGPRRCCAKKVDQVILKNLNGVFKPGINAILGPTGSGKTTLLNVLAGRKSKDNLTGKVLLNGQKQPSNFKNIAGYVIQDDMVMGMLTVRENINFSASLRLEVSEKERRQRVDDVVTELGLTKCAETRIGTYYNRGVSGGERKRTSIAMELITSLKILFLDEPTTGLDASTAHVVISILKKLANKGMTIVLTIHQPRYSIFKMFDRLFVLSKGECLYHGPSNQCLDFFANSGYICEEHDNPSDFILDVLSGNCYNPAAAAKAVDAIEHQDDSCKVDFEDTKEADKEDAAGNSHHHLVGHFSESTWNDELKLELKGQEDSSTAEITDLPKFSSFKSASFCKQFRAVASRTWLGTTRNRHALMTQIFSAVILSLIVGSIYYQIDKSTHSGVTRIQNRVGAFFFIVMNYVFGNMSAVDIFIKERSIYIHEVISGYYSVLVYFLAKLLFDVLPQRIIPITLFAVITFFMIGLHATTAQFFVYFLNILLTSVAGTSVALFFSASTRQHTIGTVFTALVWVIMMVYSGVLVNVETIPYFLQWLNWLSIFRYSMNGFLVNEMKDMKFCDDPVTDGFNVTKGHCHSGNSYLENQGIPYLEPIHLWINEIALAVIAFAFLFFTFVQLRRSVKVNL